MKISAVKIVVSHFLVIPPHKTTASPVSPRMIGKIIGGIIVPM